MAASVNAGMPAGSRARLRKRALRGATYAALVILGTAFTLPFFWLLSTSFKPADRIQHWPPDIIPMRQVTTNIDGEIRRVYSVKRPAGARAVPAVTIIKRLPGNRAVVYPAGRGFTVRPATVNADDLEPVVKPGITWSNYTRGLVFIPFFRQLRNTLIISVVSVLGTLISCSLVAYGLSRIEWRGRNTLFLVLLSVMMLPYQVVMAPLFAVFVKLGWVDTFLPLTVPTFFGNVFFIFLLRQFFMTIPRDLSEAAKLDGCSEFDIYRRVILPLAKPALAMVGLWTFMGAWNDFLGPLIYLVDEANYTLSLGLAMFLGQYGSEYGMLMAVSTVVTIPIIVLFFFTQRTFIQGITLTGIKG
ncbi:MAG: carbohydrate ABC transporter permease [Armatimonadota bacterium]|nr:carbohydrate ABC transporter permease [Armatimonadota bacterium]